MTEVRERAQAEVVAFLSDPATHGVAEVTRVETHISRIFLAGDRAWKMKRAVRTNYLDFSTLEARERICRREIEVNRAAGDIYVGVVPVVRRGAGLALGGEGVPVEWLVEMRRFDREAEFDRLCDRGDLSRADIERLADVLAASHRAAPPTPGFGGPEDLRARILQIADALSPSPAVTAWRAAAEAVCPGLAALVRSRGARIRRCHGDLHLGNIVRIEGAPVLFDAIEFNEAIASIDVLYDIALTLSDLLVRGRRDLANGLLNRYLAATRDYRGLPLMPLYLSMRGAVRALAAGSGPVAEADLDFARAALAAEHRPRMVCVGGISGTGKSTLSRALSVRLAPLAGAIILRSDVTRKRLAGVAPEVRLPAEGYTAGMDARVLLRLAIDGRAVLRAGASLIVDATFLDPAARACAARIAREEGVPFDGIWLELPAADAARRVAARVGDASDATADVVHRQVGNASPPAGWHVVAAGGAVADVEAAALRALDLPA